MRARYSILAVVAILIATVFVGLSANVEQHPAERLAHGAEIGRTLAVDGKTRSDGGGGIFYNDDYMANGSVLPALKTINCAITVNRTSYANALPSNVHIEFGDGSSTDMQYGETVTKNWTYNGTYLMSVTIYHDDGYAERLYFTVVVFDDVMELNINVSAISDTSLLTNAFVVAYHQKLNNVMDRTVESDDPNLLGQPLTASKLNILINSIIKEYQGNIFSDGINYTATVFYMNASMFYIFCYTPAVLSDYVYVMSYSDIPIGTLPTVTLIERNNTIKYTMQFEGDFTNDFNTLYFMPTLIDPIGGPQQRLIWDNYADYLGIGMLDGNFNETEAANISDLITDWMVRNITGTDDVDIIPTSFEDGIIVDSTAVFNYVQNSVRVINISTGKYNDDNRAFAISLSANYTTSTPINTTVNQHVVKIKVIPDTPYWDFKFISKFTGWNITHIETSWTQSRATSDGAPNITYENDTIVIDPDENTIPGNVTVYLYKEVTAAVEGAVTTITEEQNVLDAMLTYIQTHWLMIAIVGVGGYVVYSVFFRRK